MPTDKDIVLERVANIMEQREQILEACIAKYGDEPDRLIQVFEDGDWYVKHLDDREVDWNAQLDALHSQLDKMEEQLVWVSVEDRQPATDGMYLVHTAGEWVRQARFTSEDGWRKAKRWLEDEDVTHWKPLPMSPAAQEELR